jgi:imidazolonepropionase-like amidohydrolase
MLIAEPIAMKFAFGENPKHEHGAKDRAPMSRMASVAIIREALMRTRRYMDAIKRAEGDPSALPEFDFKCEALIPLLEGKLRVHIHAHRASDILSGLRVAKEFGLDPTIIHATEGHLIADILAEENVRVICGPMLATRSKPELSNMEGGNAAILAQHGIEVALCSDHPETPARYLSTCAAVACAEGMDERHALLAITLWAARAAGLEHRVGSIEAGKDADLLVFANHPLRQPRKPEMVFVDGVRIV